MLVNSDITIFHREYNEATRLDEWNSVYIPNAWWFKDSKSTIDTDGLKIADVCTVRIWDMSVEISKDDYIVKGECKINMQTIKDIADFEYMRVTSINKNDFGGYPHIKVVGV